MQKLGYCKKSILINYFNLQVIVLMLLGILSDSHQVNLTFMSKFPLLPQLRSDFTLSLLKDGAPSSIFKTCWVYYHIKSQDTLIEDSSCQTRFDSLSASPLAFSSHSSLVYPQAPSQPPF